MLATTTNSQKANVQRHLQQWFSEPIASVSGIQATRLESLNLMQIARLSGINQGNLRLFALGQRGLRLPSLNNLITVLKGLGYTPLSDKVES